MKRSIIYLCLACSFLACQETIKETGPEPFLETNEAFVAQPMDMAITVENLQKAFPAMKPVNQHIIRNIHYPNQYDTLVRYEVNPNDYFSFYHTKDKIILKKVEIASANTQLKSDIKVGMSKKEFAQIMQVETWPNIMKFCDLEQHQNWVFYFTNDRLTSINYDAYID